MKSKRLVLFAAAFLAACPVQGQNACVGPGAALGVTSLQCASCAISREGGVERWEFSAEPVITSVEPWSGLKAGDVIQEVKGSLITTRAGAEAFATPVEPRLGYYEFAVQRPGVPDSTIVRRGVLTQTSPVNVRVRRDGQTVAVSVPAVRNCPADGRGSGGEAGGARGGAGGGRADRVRIRDGAAGRVGGGVIPGDSITANWTVRDAQIDPKAAKLLLDSLRQFNGTGAELRARLEAVMAQLNPNRNAAGFERTGRFGFAVSCTPSCTRATAQDGAVYWKYDGFPSVAEIRPGSPAAQAGLLVGDIVTAIDGESLLTESGALRFFRNSQTATALTVSVKRNGQDLVFQFAAGVARGGGGGGRGRSGGPPPPN
jgi:hypothetical protein